MKVILSNDIGSLWATPEELAAMTDAQVWEMVREDLLEFANGCTVEVVRP
jgi:hypothetical protein